MKLKTNIIFAITTLATIIMYIMAANHQSWGPDNSMGAFFVLIWILLFGLNCVGLFFGISEKKKGNKYALIGIVGNLLHMLIFISFGTYAVFNY